MIGVMDHPRGKPEQFPLHCRQSFQPLHPGIYWTYFVHARSLAKDAGKGQGEVLRRAKRFFFEKKEPKNFCDSGPWAVAGAARHGPDCISFFASFCSQKRSGCLRSIEKPRSGSRRQ
jgi:hypothetical protein